MEEIANFTDEIIVLSKGEVQMVGSPSEIFKKAEQLRSISLDIPPIASIMNTVSAFLPNIRTDIYNANEAAEEIAGWLA
jgi:energy-coupling factor transport system ATP-binding protein